MWVEHKSIVWARTRPDQFLLCHVLQSVAVCWLSVWSALTHTELLLTCCEYSVRNCREGFGLDGATGCAAPHHFSVKFMPFLIIGFYTGWSCSIIPEVRHNGVVWSIWRFKGKSKVQLRVKVHLPSNVSLWFPVSSCFVRTKCTDFLMNDPSFFINVLHLAARSTIHEGYRKTCISKGEKRSAQMIM